jgi:2-keto-3-deoxy-L-rhamnonate aldolase RhmA
VQFFAGLGFDYLILDMEHGAMDLSRARETIHAARACVSLGFPGQTSHPEMLKAVEDVFATAVSTS